MTLASLGATLSFSIFFGTASPSGTASPLAAASPVSNPNPDPHANLTPYWISTPSGTVWDMGGAAGLGDLSGTSLDAPIVGMTPTPDGGGYWEVASDGGIFSFGDARFFGSMGGQHLDQPIVGLTPTPDGGGYWEVASDGGIFSFGDARFFGSMGGQHLDQPIVGLTPTPDGGGYWEVASDGGIFSFGDARFFGSAAGHATGAIQLLRTTPDGNGYWEITDTGDVFSFGDATQARPPQVGLFMAPSTPGERALLFAMEQLGKPYLWGGNGPQAYDCSGLTKAAWASVGVAIPRVANDQYRYGGTALSMSSLAPGDLVFWASDPSNWTTVEHVAMYIGGGQMVNAPHTGTVVRVGWIGGQGFMANAVEPQ